MAVKPGNGGNGERDPRLDLLYRDASREAPPAHLDAAILAAARREAGSRPRPLSALRRWRVPISLAAVVVLSVTLVTLVEEEKGRDSVIELRSAPAPTEARSVEPQVKPAAPAQAPELEKRAAVKAPEKLTQRRDEAAAVAEAEPGRRAVERQQAPSRAAPAAGPDTGAVASPDATGASSHQQGESPARSRADVAERPAPPVAGAAADVAPRAAAPQPKPLADNRRMQAEQALATKRAPAWQGLEQEPPAKWVERLAELRKQGRAREADELLAELKRRFPDYPLPSGLE